MPGPPATAVADGSREDGPRIPATTASAGRSDPASRRPWLLPLLVGLFALALVGGLVGDDVPDPWHPTADLAETEMKVRDTWSAHPPLIGLGGRIGTVGPDRGSHPGPVSFYALSPVYRLAGGTPTGLRVATATVQLAAVASILWLARRRGGTAGVLVAAAGVAALAASYGPGVLTFPWNPYLPVLWWVALLVAAWSVACDDWAAFPVAVFAASFCAQTHVPYLPVVAVVTTTTAAVVAARWWRARSQPASDGSGHRRRWLLGGAVLGILVWLPPVIDELTAPEGNLTRLYRYFSAPGEEVQGLGRAFRQTLVRLDPWALVTGGLPVEGWTPVEPWLPGALLLTVWAVAVVATARARHDDLLVLHLLLGAALVGAWIATSRIFGLPVNYLSLWIWGITAMVVISIAWTAAVVAGPSLRRRWGPRLGPVAVIGAAVVIGAELAALAVEPVFMGIVEPRRSHLVASVAPPLAATLAEGAVPGTGRAGRYEVTADDSENPGLAPIGIVNELERQGFAVGLGAYQRAAVSSHRVETAETATAEIHLSTGTDIDRWRADHRAIEVASVEPTLLAIERHEQDRRRRALIDGLRAAGRIDLAERVVDDLPAVATDPGLPLELRIHVVNLERIDDGLEPVAVFVRPVDDAPAPEG